MTASTLARPGLPTLQDAIEAVKIADLSTPEKEEIIGDVDVACQWFGLKPEEITAHPANLNPRFRRLSPGGLGVTPKRIANVKRNVKRALAYVRQGDANGRSFKAELFPHWQQLHDAIPDRYRRVTVKCLMQFCSARAIEPYLVDDAVSNLLLQALTNERLNGRPRITHQNATRCWNWCVENVPGWPQRKLTIPRYGKTYILPPEALPTALLEAMESRIARATTADPFDLSRPMKTWRTWTAHTYRTLWRRYLSLLVRAGIDLSSIGIADVATVEMAEVGLRHLLMQSQMTSGYVMAGNIAALLAQFAPTPASAKQLWELSMRLKNERPIGRVARARLQPLKDQSNLARLFLLPFALVRQLKRLKRGEQRRLLLQWATALMLLTFCPLRISTLSGLRRSHLRWSRGDLKGELSLEFAEGELKNGDPVSMPVPKECADLIRLQLAEIGGVEFLFPGGDVARSKLPGVLSQQLRQLVYKRLGLEVNPHLYRHVVHLVILRRFPGAYTMISRVLTHRSLETAIRNYAHFDVELSMRAYHQMIRDVQNGAAPAKTASVATIANPME